MDYNNFWRRIFLNGPKNFRNDQRLVKLAQNPRFVMTRILVKMQMDEIIKIATSKRLPPISLVCAVLRAGQLD